jgi:hypothetical protein
MTEEPHTMKLIVYQKRLLVIYVVINANDSLARFSDSIAKLYPFLSGRHRPHTFIATYRTITSESARLQYRKRQGTIGKVTAPSQA